MQKNILIALALVVICALFLGLRPGSDAEKLVRLQLAIGYGLGVLIFLFGIIILLGIAAGDIQLATLLSESGGGASMSRFQLLIFTFVIALSLFFLVAQDKKFPAIPSEVLTLLGISATTYGVSKGIQAASPDMKSKTNGDGNGANGAAQQAQQQQQVAQQQQQNAQQQQQAAQQQQQQAQQQEHVAQQQQQQAQQQQQVAQQQQPEQRQNG